MKRGGLVALLWVIVSADARAQGPAPAMIAQKKNGFALETHLQSQLIGFGAGLAGTVYAPLINGGIFGGAKIDRIIVGLGFDFTSVDEGGGANIAMRWAPGVRVAILRSEDERVELFGQLDLRFGHDFGSGSKNVLFGMDLAPGVRYWLHPQFAFSALAGWNADWLLYDPMPKVVIQGIFAGVQVLAVF